MAVVLACPNCTKAFSGAEGRRLTPFWAGAGIIVCRHCDKRIQWMPPMRRRIVIGGWLFKLGSLAFLWFLLASRVIGGAWESVKPTGVMIAAAAILCGLFATATRDPSKHLEISRDSESR